MDRDKNRLFFYWNIGRNVHNNHNSCDNVIERYSNYYTYYFGNRYKYTRENIKYMEKFYLNFPIFYKKLGNISWEQYKLLLNIKSKKERFFYFRLMLLFKNDYYESLELLKNNYYNRL